jgi:UDPglucose 6-dehydrogenase
MKSISFIGLGPVGLCTTVCFAAKGYKVTAFEKDTSKANQIKSGEPCFYEPHLKEYLEKTQNKNLKIVTNNEEAILQSDITFITVGTPAKANGTINLRYLTEASNEIGKSLKKKKEAHLIIVKSTVTPGTTQNIVKPLVEKNSGRKCGRDFFLCFNPEFLREGNAIKDVLEPDYIVIGGYDQKSAEMLKELYSEFHKDSLPSTIQTNIPTAELIKYANNTFLATKISLINTVANICERIPGVDVTTVAEAIGKDHRINPHFLNAGLGWGGSCFRKDLQALINFSKERGYRPTLLETTCRTNDLQIKFTIEKIREKLKRIDGKRIAVLGLAFKPNTDDIRESQSMKLVEQLQKEGSKVSVYDPMAIPNARRIFSKGIRYASSAIECLKNSDCAVLATEWEEFRKLKTEDFVRNMKTPILIDGRRLYDPVRFSKQLCYMAIGLGSRTEPQL